MSETGDDLRATSEAIAADAEHLRALEEAKQALPDDHPEVLRISREVERVVRELVPKATAERELAEAASEEG